MIQFASPTAPGSSAQEFVPWTNLAPTATSHFQVREAVSSENEYRFEDWTAIDEDVRPTTPHPFDDVDAPTTPPLRDDNATTIHPLPGVDAPTTPSLDDDDALDELAEEIATLAAHIHAATHRLLTLIAEFDHRRGWESGGHRSCAHWLSFRTGIDMGTAREKVRTARALADLPETSASMARGELSFSQVRALSRVATAENEEDLLELARGCTTAQLERMVRSLRCGSREDEAALEKARHARRTLSVFPDDDGMYVVRGRLPAEVGALLMRAVEAASDALYRKERGALLARDGEKEVGPEGDPKAETGPHADPKAKGQSHTDPKATAQSEIDSDLAAARRRADALGLLAERALAAGFEAGPISGSRAERYQVVLHVEPETLMAEVESADTRKDPGRSELEDGSGVSAETQKDPGRSELEDGTHVSAETCRRLSCDTGLVRVSHAPDGRILDVGRRTRTISPALRRALEARDRGCRFPGCGLRFSDAHHVRHWADGGETSLGNTLLLCRHHHRLVHEGGWTVNWWGEGRPVFFDPRGGTHFEGRWEPPEIGENPVVALLTENRRRRVRPDGWTASARWKREADIPDQVYFRALEALHESVP